MAEGFECEADVFMQLLIVHEGYLRNSNEKNTKYKRKFIFSSNVFEKPTTRPCAWSQGRQNKM